MNHCLLEMRNISKSFPGVTALDNVSFKLNAGEVHALMGENGAGKSTLMKILIGLYHQNSGEILLDGKNVRIQSPRDALDCGISMIHQELNPIPEMTIAENIFLGREPRIFKAGILNRKELNRKTREIFDQMGLKFNPEKKMSKLSVAETQMVEIAKAISYGSRIVVMDEPTSAITEKEVRKLFEIINLMKSKGAGIIYISHKLDELFEICDTITVLRDGKYIGTKSMAEMDKDSLITMMVGREIKDIFPKSQTVIGDVVLSVKGLTKKGTFKDVSFELRKGEVLGIAGLMGAGRTELVEAIFGIHRPDAGEITVKGKKIRIRKPKDAIKQGLALVSEDRKGSGLNLRASVSDNISIVTLKKFCSYGVISKKKERESVDLMIEKLSVKTPSGKQRVMSLSGGNQQKIVIAKWILSNPDIIILDEPTRGIDVGAKSEIHRLISILAQEGKAVLMISSELPEIMGMSDRVIVLHEGQITGVLNRQDFKQEKIMEYASGHRGEF